MPAKAKKPRTDADRLLPGVRAWRWWVSWHWASVIVTAATPEEAVALVRGMGYFGPGYVAVPKCRVVRATRRHADLFDAGYVANEYVKHLEAARDDAASVIEDQSLDFG